MTVQIGQQVTAGSVAPVPDFALVRAHQRTPVLRRCGGEPCTDCDQEEVRRSAVGTAPGLAPPAVHDVPGSAGAPLDAGVRAFMEPRFGEDFSGVRVHTEQRGGGGGLAPKLEIGAVDDPAELEADQIADQVMQNDHE